MKRAKGIPQRLKALDRLLKDGRPRSALETRAIQRQMNDLQKGHERGLVWDEEAAQRAVAFFSLLRHWKGEWAGKPFVLEPWQEHGVVAPLFGWMVERCKKLVRRFRTAYEEIARKNGKTTQAAGIALQGLVADGESGAEVYCAATMRDQACILFNDARRCLSPELRKLIKEWSHALTFERTHSTMRPLSADHDTLDGLNPSRAVVDEFHAHKHRGLWDVIIGGQGAREQPLTLGITTAGVDRHSICWEVREIARNILEGAPDHNDSFFAFICCADDDDDWEDPETWRKANPNLGVALKIDFLRELAKQAKASPTAEANFRRKHLNQWVGAESTWIEVVNWDRGKVAAQVIESEFRERSVFAAVDLGWRDDYAALAAIAPERVKIRNAEDAENAEKGREKGDAHLSASSAPSAFQIRDPSASTSLWKIRRAWAKVFLFVPESGRRDITQAPLANWIAQGLVTVTPGNATDIDAILLAVEQLAGMARLLELALDPNNARQFGQEVMARALCSVFEFRQNKANYNEPCREFEKLAADGLIYHDGNDCLRWQIGNVVMESDARGYVMPAKDKSHEKIDGPVALLMAFARALFSDPDAGRCVYEQRGMLVL